MPDKLYIHSIMESEDVNGPGNRLVIWTQGCCKGCVGCFNPSTWKSKTGKIYTVKELADLALSKNFEGLTLTGGDPLEQSDSLFEFLKLIHFEDFELKTRFPLGIICFTGYVIEELSGSALSCLDYIDLLIDGRFVKELRYSSGLAGSSNQRFHFSNKSGRGISRIPKESILIDQSIEITEDLDVTGFPVIDYSSLRSLGIKIK